MGGWPRACLRSRGPYRKIARIALLASAGLLSCDTDQTEVRGAQAPPPGCGSAAGHTPNSLARAVRVTKGRSGRWNPANEVAVIPGRDTARGQGARDPGVPCVRRARCVEGFGRGRTAAGVQWHRSSDARVHWNAQAGEPPRAKTQGFLVPLACICRLEWSERWSTSYR